MPKFSVGLSYLWVSAIYKTIPTKIANPTLTAFEIKNAFLDSANNGKAPCPSWTMQLARKMPSGRSPLANKMRKIKCGPDCGMRPINIAINKTMKGLESIMSWMFT